MRASELHDAFPSYGRDWDAAIDHGIDVSLLLRNLELSPSERIEELQDWLEFCEQIQGKANEQTPSAR